MSSVLRLGHRPGRDKRMTTHVGLTARAFGMEKMFLPEMDSKVKNTLDDVTERFGADFSVKEEKDWRGLIKEWDGDVIHLTMYGSDIDDFFSEQEIKNPLIVVGSQKVPRDVYDLSDFNVSVGNQPHSEVAALAVFMDRFHNRSIPETTAGEMSVLPSDSDKRVVDYSEVPSAKECFEFARERGMDDDLIAHTMSVLERALHLQNEHGGDLRLIIAGALLHDIGRTVTHGVDHGVEGSKIIEEKGWSEELQKIVERHIGGGITKKEAEEAGLPARSYVPETLEGKIICHADNTAGDRERFEYQIQRAEEAGHHESAKRMKKLAREFEEDL
ncbi:MAG: HD domain-containing protein [Candidatus Thermoplasmatota archaeon]